MSNILDIETNDDQIIVSGSIDKIFSNKRAVRFMKDWMLYEELGDTLRFEITDDLNKCLDRLKNIAQMIGCALKFSEKINDAVNEYLLEEEKFKEFSLQALNIRNNNCNIVEFKAFKDSLIHNVPNRTLYDLQMLSAYHMNNILK